jgi:alpha-L-rhamnosidase
MKKQFISADQKLCGIRESSPAPALRRAFTLDFAPVSATLQICGLGFYALFVNGREITKGPLAPYISNPDHFCYVDTYDVAPYLTRGENVIGVLLGNGFNNPFGGFVWDFDQVPWRDVPKLALELTATGAAGESRTIVADPYFRTHPSPILWDEYRFGEHYDARLEKLLGDWTSPGYDDHTWIAAKIAAAPRGELRACTCEPIAVTQTVSPVAITKVDGGHLYDFGVNTAGVTALRLVGAAQGQEIRITHGEELRDGKLSCYNIKFGGRPDFEENYKLLHYTNIYTAHGQGEVEEHTPRFVYHGFRYAFVEGMTDEQATPEALTMLIMHSDLRHIGDFSCSDETVNRLYNMARISDLANFYYVVTDCPHREKNGWTGDASMSSDHMIMMYDVEKSWRQWLDNIRAAQSRTGGLPGIVPTDTWGYLGNDGFGPAWDAVLFNLPYMLYRFRGNTDVIRENAHAMLRYLEFALTHRREDGTVAFGLGDWLPVGYNNWYVAPLYVTSTITLMDIARKAAEMFRAIGQEHSAVFAQGVADDLRAAIRRTALNTETMTLEHNGSQTPQAMGLYYGVFEPEEEAEAFARLREMIAAKGDNFDCGLLGMHCLFHVLTAHGESELAYHLITKKDFPSYAHWIETGETSLVEMFMEKFEDRSSHNHHMYGDIARWFTTTLAGLRPVNDKKVLITPTPVGGLTWAQAHCDLPAGRVSVRWERDSADAKTIRLTYTVPEGVSATVQLPEGFEVG